MIHVNQPGRFYYSRTQDKQLQGYQQRKHMHDREALAMVSAVLQHYGFLVFRYGVETGPAECASLLRQQLDNTSILVRYRPDLLAVLEGRRTVLCEVKSQRRQGNLFFVEFDSWRAAQMVNASGSHLFYAFADLHQKRLMACWAHRVRPLTVSVPKRFDYEQQMERLRRQFPTLRLVPTEHRNGSGTPYFSVSRRSEVLLPLDMFVETELLTAAEAPVRR